MFVNAFPRKFSQKFRKFRCNVAKIVPKFRNFIGIKKFLHLCTKNIEICEFFCETIFAYLRMYVHFNPFRMRQQYTTCDISSFKNTVVLANPILRHMNKSYIIQKQLCMDFRSFLRFLTLFTCSGYHASLLPLWQTFESNPSPGTSTR